MIRRLIIPVDVTIYKIYLLPDDLSWRTETKD